MVAALVIVIVFAIAFVLSGSSSAFPAAVPLTFVATNSWNCRPRQCRTASSSASASSGLPARDRELCILRERATTASASSIGEENVVGIDEVDPTAPSTSTQSATNNAVPPSKHQEILDKISFVEQTENIPLGQLTPDIERDMLSLMRQLSPMGRRYDDTIDGVLGRSRTPSFKNDGNQNATSNYARQRRQDAIIVERLLDRLLKEYQFAVDNKTDDINSDRREDDDNINNRHRRSKQINVNSAQTYNIAIKAWANANVRGSAEKADRILKRLKIASSTIGKLGGSIPLTKPLGPDIYSFAYCYAAWYKESIFASKQVDNMKASSIALRKADSVLQSMKQLLMTTTGEDDNLVNDREWNMAEDVNSLLTMWSNTDPTLPEMQETFVRFIEVESRDVADFWLNTRSFNLVINGELTLAVSML